MSTVLRDSITRSEVIFGTTEPVEPMRTLRAGWLSVQLDGGGLRYLRWGGFEVIRGIAFVLRDTSWGTHSPSIEGLRIREDPEGFHIAYSAVVSSPDGAFTYSASIAGTSDGQLDFEVAGRSDTGFTTCRTGFIVLHPLAGVVGHPFEAWHPGGHRERADFPVLIDPAPPATEIVRLDHAPAPGMQLSIRFEGEVFEMEDHRNWTDASFKTYSRPLSRGYPYRIDAGAELIRAVRIRVSGSPPTSVDGQQSRLGLTATDGTLPRVGVFLEDGFESTPGAACALHPSFVLGRIDLDEPDSARTFERCACAASQIGSDLALEVVVRGVEPVAELASLARLVAKAPGQLSSITVFARRDLRSRPAGTLPAGEAPAADIVEAARTAFPGLPIGGGVPVGFAELNRNPPPAGLDFLTHSTQATFHAADDRSVMETLEALPHVVNSGRVLSGGLPYRLGPATIGLPKGWCAGQAATNPGAVRVAMAEADPRQSGLFAAAFALGYAAVAAREGVEEIVLASISGPSGAVGGDGGWRPVAVVLAGLAELAGRPRVEVHLPTSTLAGLASSVDGRSVMWLANLSAEPTEIEIAPDLGFGSLMMMDAAALAAANPEALPEVAFACARVVLDSFAVLRLR